MLGQVLKDLVHRQDHLLWLLLLLLLLLLLGLLTPGWLLVGHIIVPNVFFFCCGFLVRGVIVFF